MDEAPLFELAELAAIEVAGIDGPAEAVPYATAGQSPPRVASSGQVTKTRIDPCLCELVSDTNCGHGRCREIERQENDPRFLGYRVSLPRSDTMFGDLDRRERWLAHLGMEAGQVDKVSRRYQKLCYTHFQRRCLTSSSQTPGKHRTMKTSVERCASTDPDDFVMVSVPGRNGKVRPAALVVPDVKFPPPQPTPWTGSTQIRHDGGAARANAGSAGSRNVGVATASVTQLQEEVADLKARLHIMTEKYEGSRVRQAELATKARRFEEASSARMKWLESKLLAVSSKAKTQRSPKTNTKAGRKRARLSRELSDATEMVSPREVGLSTNVMAGSREGDDVAMRNELEEARTDLLSAARREEVVENAVLEPESVRSATSKSGSKGAKSKPGSARRATIKSVPPKATGLRRSRRKQ